MLKAIDKNQKIWYNNIVIKRRKEVNKMRINLDMDGTIADFYNVKNWLDYLIAEDTTPYEIAKPLLRLCTLARLLNKLQTKGYEIGIISWLSKNGTENYNNKVTETKIKWLKKHLPSVHWDSIIIVPYGTPKENYCFTENDILFDDELSNRQNWTGQAYDVKNILEILKKHLTN